MITLIELYDNEKEWWFPGIISFSHFGTEIKCITLMITHLIFNGQESEALSEFLICLFFKGDFLFSSFLKIIICFQFHKKD